MKPEIRALLGPPPDSSDEAVAILFSYATSERSKKWQRMSLTWPEFARRMTRHVFGEKRGSAITPAVFENDRRSIRGAAKVRVAVLDSDKGAPFPEIVYRLEELGFAAAIATSHSHLSTELLVPKTVWDKWLQGGDDRIPQEYMLSQGYRPAVAEAASLKLDNRGRIINVDNVPGISCVVICHGPCPKLRIFVPVRTPWKASDGQDAYRQGLETLAGRLGVAADPSGMDPAHLFFEPRYRRDGPTPESMILHGALADPWAGKTRSNTASREIVSVAETAPIISSEEDLANLARESRNQNVAMDFSVFTSAVMAIRNDERYNSIPDFLRVLGGIAVETQKSEAGWDLACRWIESRVGGNRDPSLSREYWDGLRISFGGGDSTGATIIHLARQDGWRLPTEKQVTFGDLDMGMAFADETRGRLLYISGSDEWLRWHGSVWTKVETSEMELIAKSVARRAHETASRQFRENPNELTKVALLRAGRYIDSIDRARKIVEAGRSEPGMNVSSRSDFDTDRMTLGVLNGAVDLKTGRFFRPDPEYRISKQAGTSFDYEARCPQYQEFLCKIQPDIEVRRFIQRWVGYVITGDVGELKWLFCYGTGANGKTAFVNLISKLMGDYVYHADSSLLTRNKHENEAARQVAQLPGRRLISANETGRADIFDDERMKRLVSQEPINARFLHREAFNFSPTGKLILQGNHRPIVQDDSNGFWRRMVLMQFPVQLSKSEMIRDVDRRIFAAESKGILNWAIEGCLEWQAHGLCPPASLEADKEDYKAESDTLGQWIEQCCIIGEETADYLGDLYRTYAEHHREQGLSPMAQPSFTRAMRSRGFPKNGSKSRPKLLGLTLDSGFQRRPMSEGRL